MDRFRDLILEVAREVVREELAKLAQKLQPPADDSDFISLKEAAALARRESTKTIRNWIEAGKITGYGEGSKPLVKRSELLAYLSKPRAKSKAEKPATAPTAADFAAKIVGE